MCKLQASIVYQKYSEKNKRNYDLKSNSVPIYTTSIKVIKFYKIQYKYYSWKELWQMDECC